MITSWVNHLEKQRTKMNTKSKKKKNKSSQLASLYPTRNCTKVHEGPSALLSNHNRCPPSKRQNRPPFLPSFFYNQKQNSKHFPSLLMTKFQPPREKETKLTAPLFLLEDPFFFLFSSPTPIWLTNLTLFFLSFI